MTLHYTSGGTGSAIAAAGFNIADVTNVSALNALPAGMKGLVYLGEKRGATQAFIDKVRRFVNNGVTNPKLFGFFLCDEPDPRQTAPSLLKAEADYIHANVPGAKVFIAMNNMGTTAEPNYRNTYNPENTNIDLFGIGYYPINTAKPPVYDRIDKQVAAAIAAGIPLAQIVPIYQTFGGGNWQAGDGGSFKVPTPEQLTTMLDRWRKAVPDAVFDYAYKWGTQNEDTGLESLPELQAVCLKHNTEVVVQPPVTSKYAAIAQTLRTLATQFEAL